MHVLFRTQHVSGPAGNVFTGGLEEALFDIHIAKITHPHDFRVGSPAAGVSSIFHTNFSQKLERTYVIDGPPLRALVLIKYAEWLLQPQQNNGTWVADVLWPAINLDLQWISQHWNESSYVWNSLWVTTRPFKPIFITGGTSGGRPYGVGHTGRRRCNIARYERGPASLG